MATHLPIVEKSVYRFDESESARNEAAPSVSFLNPKLREEEIKVPDNEPVIFPEFERDGIYQVVTLKVSSF